MEILGYDLNVKNSHFVKEGDDIVSTKDYVYTTNLYSCVALYAVCGKTKYLGHINVLNRSEFRNGRTEKVYYMFDELSKTKTEDTLFVGLVYGAALDFYQGDKYEVIAHDLNQVIIRLEKSGIKVERLDDLNSEELVIDGVNNAIVTEYDSIEIGESQIKIIK